MKKQQNVPLRVPIYDQKGHMDNLWVRWFQGISQNVDDFRQTPDEIYTTDATLTTRDFGKRIIVDCSYGHRTLELMTVSVKDLFCWVTIFRKGENRLTIVPDSATAIEYGSPGGRIWNDEKLRRAANVTLELISVSQWGIIGATGKWNVA